MDDPLKQSVRVVNHLGVLQRLTNALPYLSEAERRLVIYVLNHPDEAVGMNVADLAEAAGVGEATAFRLFRHLDFGGYTLLREQLRDTVGKVGEEFCAPIGAHNRVDPDMCSLLSGAYIGMRALLDACTIGQAQLNRAVEAILTCRRLSIAGMGGISGRLAEIALFSFQRLGLTTMLWIDSQVVSASTDSFQPGDVLIGISHSGENEALSRFVRLASDRGVTSIALTNYASSSVAQYATIPLTTSFREDSVENYDLLPRLSQMMVLQLLLDMVRQGRAKQGGDS